MKEVLVATTPMSATTGITKKELPQLQIRSGQTAFIAPPEVKTGQPVDVKLPMTNGTPAEHVDTLQCHFRALRHT